VTAVIVAGSVVRIPRPESPTKPRPAHRLARVKTAPVAHPYVMDCGITAGLVEPTTAEAGRCARCWPKGAA
jgi:hypothetical protein